MTQVNSAKVRVLLTRVTPFSFRQIWVNRRFSEMLRKEGNDESTIVVTGLNSSKTHIILLVERESLALGRKLNFRVRGKEG